MEQLILRPVCRPRHREHLGLRHTPRERSGSPIDPIVVSNPAGRAVAAFSSYTGSRSEPEPAVTSTAGSAGQMSAPRARTFVGSDLALIGDGDFVGITNTERLLGPGERGFGNFWMTASTETTSIMIVAAATSERGHAYSAGEVVNALERAAIGSE